MIGGPRVSVLSFPQVRRLRAYEPGGTVWFQDMETDRCGMKNLSLAVFTLGFLGLAASGASAFTSREGSRVNPVSAAVFEVIPKAGGLGRNYWCAAGDYAQRALKAPWEAHLYISRARGASETTNRRSAVQFTLEPSLAGSPVKGDFASVNALRRGDNMRVRDAFNLCHQLPAGF